MTKQIATARAAIEKYSAAVPGLTRELATRGADAVDGLRASMTTWFNFSNGYDPLFTWWMGQPYQQLDAALAYSGFLRELQVPDRAAELPAAAPIAPAAAPALAEVPDLTALIALPQDEMTAVVQRFIGTNRPPAAGAATNSPGAGRPSEYDVDWLAALKTLDFDRLSRNAQVDYLFIRNACER